MKKKILISLGAIFISGLIAFNFHLIRDKDNLRTSLRSITRIALADNEGEYKGKVYVCNSCVPAPGQVGIKWDCDDVHWEASCTPMACGYGTCS